MSSTQSCIRPNLCKAQPPSAGRVCWERLKNWATCYGFVLVGKIGKSTLLRSWGWVCVLCLNVCSKVMIKAWGERLFWRGTWSKPTGKNNGKAFWAHIKILYNHIDARKNMFKVSLMFLMCVLCQCIDFNSTP